MRTRVGGDTGSIIGTESRVHKDPCGAFHLEDRHYGLFPHICFKEDLDSSSLRRAEFTPPENFTRGGGGGGGGH